MHRQVQGNDRGAHAAILLSAKAIVLARFEMGDRLVANFVLRLGRRDCVERPEIEL